MPEKLQSFEQLQEEIQKFLESGEYASEVKLYPEDDADGSF